MKASVIQFCGWYGVAAILSAYFLVSFLFIAPGGLAYQLLNFTGSLGIALVAYSKKDRQPLWLNIVWMCIGAVILFRLFFAN